MYHFVCICVGIFGKWETDFFFNLKSVCPGAEGVDSVGKMLAMQLWRPGIGSPVPTKSGCDDAHL